MAETDRAWLSRIVESAPLHALSQLLLREGQAVADGSRGSSTALLAGALAVRTQRPVVLVVAHLDEADDALEDLGLFNEAGYALSCERFGALEVLPGESGLNLELLAERLGVVGRLAQGQAPDVLVAPVQALMQAVPEPEAIGQFALNLAEGSSSYPPEKLGQWLGQAGYQRQDAIEQPGDFAIRGGIVDIYPPAGQTTDPTGGSELGGPIRLDYFGDEIDAINRIDLSTMGSGQRLTAVRLIGASIEQIQSDERTMNVLDVMPENAVPILHEVMELTEQGRGYYERLTNPTGIFAPKAVFQKLTQRAHVEVRQYSSGGSPASKITMPLQPLAPFDQEAAKAVRELAHLTEEPNQQVIVLCRKSAERDRLRELLQEHAPDQAEAVRLEVGTLHRGFVWQESGQVAQWPSGQGTGKAEAERREASDSAQPTNASTDRPPQAIATENDPATASANAKTAQATTRPLDHSATHLIPHHELFHRFETRRRVRRVSSDATAQASDAFVDLDVGDYVVHVDHGIAKFNGLKTLKRGGVTQEYLTLQFAQQATLHVPATQIDLVQKYIGGFEGKPPLSALGGKKWQKQKESVREAVKDLAAELLRVQAARHTQPGTGFPRDTAWQREFEAEFPYEETEDQLAAIEATKYDMTEDEPMDRLICGDVGFGKTEVAVRAAFKAVEYGKQVAILVPTTVLAEQHERTFKERFADYPFNVESISRFKTKKEQADVLRSVKDGRIDVIIGTHRLLSGDVRFSELGLVIIDEEQRFGVEHKHKLLELRLTVDVLTLTATPIPRTLHMAMVGLRNISSLSTPPMDRRSIVTEVVPFEEQRIQQAIYRELNRQGQVYFVHNRVHNIHSVASQIQQLAPEARIAVGHGQMSGRELEQVMLRFIRREVDVLVCTTIIESGIDIPTANTMFINQADQFGLAELHQLRGRVGRYKHRAYCYLLLPQQRQINETAAKRLKALEQYSMLGAGFKIAMRDLEIRGAGNLLGKEQSGHIAAVGYELYCTLLEQETKKLKNEPIIEPAKTHLELPIRGQIPRTYIKADKHRMEMYRRLSRATTLSALDEVVQAMTDAYGEKPEPVDNLIQLTELRIAASTFAVDAIKLEHPDLIFTVSEPAKLDELLAPAPGRVSVVDEQTVYYRPPENYLDPPATLLAVLRKLLVRPLRQREQAHESEPVPADQAG
jgi:transcription-repair coupling factor (superfamily II helicase)